MGHIFVPLLATLTQEHRQTGPGDNLGLSEYLAGQRDVDFNRIHTIGLGEQKLADPSTSSEARTRNRRVEVKIYSADESSAGGTTSR